MAKKPFIIPKMKTSQRPLEVNLAMFASKKSIQISIKCGWNIRYFDLCLLSALKV